MDFKVEMIVEDQGTKVLCLCDSCQNLVIKYKSQLTNLTVQFCSNSCSSKAKRKGNVIDLQVRKRAIEKFGVEHHLKSENVKRKRIQTNIERYGVSNQFERKDLIEMNSIMVANRSLEQQREIDTKRITTVRNKYGVDHPSQALVIHERMMRRSKSRHHRGHVKTQWGTFWFRSSWEKLFLDWCVENSSKVQNVRANVPISYDFAGKSHIFFADFQITTMGHNFLCEIKPDSLATTPQSVAKFDAARKWCSIHDMIFVHLNEQYLNQLDSLFVDGLNEPSNGLKNLR